MRVIPYLVLLSSIYLNSTSYLHAGECHSNNCDNNNDDLGKGLLTLGIGTTIVGAGTTVGLVLTTVKSEKKDQAQYIKENSEEIAKHLTLGKGKTLEDLRKLYKVPNEKEDEAIKRMQGQRVSLLETIQSPNLSPEAKAEAFDKVIAGK